MSETSRGEMVERSIDFESKKTKYFSEFALGLKTHFNTLKEGGVSGKKAKMEGWRNISEHCLVEAVMADVIAEKLNLDRDKIKVAALVHDWYKRQEMEIAKKDKVRGFDSADSEDKKKLLELGYPEDIINIAHSVGHTSLKRMQEDGVTTEEQVMHYIDSITVGSEISTLDKRIDNNEANPRYHELNESGRKIFNGQTYFEVLREVGKEIEQKIATAIGLDTPESLPKFIKEEIERRIENFK